MLTWTATELERDAPDVARTRASRVREQTQGVFSRD